MSLYEKRGRNTKGTAMFHHLPVGAAPGSDINIGGHVAGVQSSIQASKNGGTTGPTYGLHQRNKTQIVNNVDQVADS